MSAKCQPSVLLILGGSCFVGRELAFALAQRTQSRTNPTRVVLANRGRTYWGLPLEPTLGADVRHIVMDRTDAGSVSQGMACVASVVGSAVAAAVSVSASSPSLCEGYSPCSPIEQQIGLTVVDFSCDSAGDLHRVLSALAMANVRVKTDGILASRDVLLAHFLRRYVLISTDSIYRPVDPWPDSGVSETSCAIDASSTTLHHGRWLRWPRVDDARAITSSSSSGTSSSSSSSSSSSGSSSDSDDDNDDESDEPYGLRKINIEFALCLAFGAAELQPQLGELRMPPPDYANVLAHCGTAVVILRCPDVVGPFDDTSRFYATVLWALSGKVMPFPTELLTHRMSVVFSADLVRLLLLRLTDEEVALPLHSVCSTRDSGKSMVAAFNVASPVVTVGRFTQLIAKRTREVASEMLLLRLDDSEPQPWAPLVRTDESTTVTCDFYPSVRCGPLDCSAAERQLLWSGTSVDTVVDHTVRFFLAHFVAHRSAWRESDELARAVRKLPQHVRSAIT